MTDKPNLTRVWAKTAPGGNVVDPDTVTAGKFTAGWQAEIPPFEYFNFIQKQVTEGLAHINEQGIAVWDDVTPYPVGGLAKGSDGNVYKALVSQSDNDPVSDDGTNWIDELNNRVIRVTSVAEGFADLTGLDGMQYKSNSFHVDARYGQRTFVYRADEPKAGHGVKGWSSTVPAVSLQAGATLSERTLAFLNATGETDPTGDGLFVFSDFGIMTTHDLGIVPNSGDVLELLQFGHDNFDHFMLANGDYEIQFTGSIGLTLKSNKDLYWHSASLTVLPTDRGTYFALYGGFQGDKNVTLHAPVIIGDRDTHLGTTGELGILIALYSTQNVRIINPTLSKAWGDGIYVGADSSENPCSVDIEGVARIFDCRRQGISVVHCTRFTADTLIISDISGIDPQYGIDIEPNNANSTIIDFHIKTLITNNTQGGLGIALRNLDTTSQPVSIKVDYLSDTNSRNALRADVTGGDEPTGLIEIGVLKSIRSDLSALNLRRWTTLAPQIHIGKVYIEDANESNSAFLADGAPISLLTLAGESAGYPLANIKIDSVKIVKTASGASTLNEDLSIRDSENDAIEFISITQIDTNSTNLMQSPSQALVDESTTTLITRYGELVVYSGSNSNGEWTRWEDGTQVCKHVRSFSGFDAANSNADWVFPAEFLSGEYVLFATASGRPEIGIAHWPGSQFLGTQGRMRITEAFSGNVTLFAQGRWK